MIQTYKHQFNTRNTRAVTAATTLLITDGKVNCGGTTNYAMTCFAQSALTSGQSGHAAQISATGTGVITITPATGETVNGGAGFALNPGDEALITYEFGKKNWLIVPQFVRKDVTTGNRVIVANTNGTTAVDVFGPAGAPFAGTIVDVTLTSLDTTGGNIIVTTADGTVCTIAKGTSDTAVIGQSALANTAFAKGSAVQVDSSSAGDAAVRIYYNQANTLE